MLEAIAVFLMTLWLLGLANAVTAGGLIHVLLAVSGVVIVFRVLQNRRLCNLQNRKHVE
jgi:hypothetical protein